jgi:hypothetical protein
MGTPPDAVLDGSRRPSLLHDREFRRKQDRLALNKPTGC